MNTPKVKLLDDRVLVKPDEKITKSSHGLFIPESSQKEMHQGIVVAIGDGLDHPNSFGIRMALNNIALALKGTDSQTSNAITTNLDTAYKMLDNNKMKIRVGDKVVYGKFSGTDLEIEGVKYVIMLQGDIKLKMEEKTDLEKLKK